ncbi:MAG: ABC transporter permease, partial [Clostridiales bacterium]|nr:ABC transporter permease [Clostridiales bacterium]
MKKFRDVQTENLEQAADAVRAMSEEELFSFADHSEGEAENIGFSNYSYWGSTVAMFLKKKVAVTLLAVLVLLVAFTFVQPLLPGQYEATRIINHPITGMQMSNVGPSLTTSLL